MTPTHHAPAFVICALSFAACTGGVVDAGDGDAGENDEGALDAGVDDAGAHDAGVDDAGAIDAGVDEDAGAIDAGPRYLTTLSSLDDLALLDSDTGEVKFLAPVDGVAREPPLVEDCYFQNMQLTPWHQVFLMGFEETADISFQDYTAWVLRRATRKWWGGSVKFYPTAVHPFTGTPPVLVYTAYAEQTPASALDVDDLVEVKTRLATCIPFAVDFLAFLPTDAMQSQLVVQAASALEDAGVATYTP